MIDKTVSRTLEHILRATILLGIAGCTSVQPTSPQEATVTIPQAVVNIADPRQNLTTARLRAQDNCYWYQHTNPLEVTLLPLRTIDGRPICAS